MLVDAPQQFLAVVVDELAGQDHKAILSGLPACVQHLGQLAWEGYAGLVAELAGGVIDDACFGGVGGHIFQLVGDGQLQHGTEAVLFVRIDAAGDRGNNALAVDRLPVFDAPEVQGVQALLLIQLLADFGAAVPGLDNDTFAVPACLFVGKIEPVVHESPQEVALAELHHPFGCFFQDVAGVARGFQGCVVKFFHCYFLLSGHNLFIFAFIIYAKLLGENGSNFGKTLLFLRFLNCTDKSGLASSSPRHCFFSA